MNMIEKVARALAKIAGYDPDGDPNYFGPTETSPMTEVAWPPEARLWWRYRREARAAIAAMREPTDAMMKAYWDSDWGCSSDPYTPDPEDLWPQMIDAALRETSE